MTCNNKREIAGTESVINIMPELDW